MKRCLSCNSIHNNPSFICPNCAYQPEKSDQFYIHSPEFAFDGTGFKESYFAELFIQETKNFWFRSRNSLILWALEKYCKDFQSLLELGCGTGFVLSGIAEHHPCTNLFGSEIFLEGLNYTAKRIPSASCMQMDARNIPYNNEFDVIGAFDVLEHIEEDEQVISQAYESLQPQGIFLITVPQHKWLWSAVDDHACHVRRYSPSELQRKLKNANFSILKDTSFVSTLLPAMLISRFLKKKNSQKSLAPKAELSINPILNAIFFQILRAEVALIKLGVTFPAGGSRFIVAKK